MPSAGGFSQTAINQRAGARTQLSELVTVAARRRLRAVPRRRPQRPARRRPWAAWCGRRARPDQARRVRPVLAAQPPRVLGGRRSRPSAAGSSGSSSPSPSVSSSPSCSSIVELDRIEVTELQATPALDDVQPAGPGHRAGARAAGAALRRAALHGQRARANRPLRRGSGRQASRRPSWSTPRRGLLPVTVIEQFADSNASWPRATSSCGSPPCRRGRWPPPASCHGRRAGGCRSRPPRPPLAAVRAFRSRNRAKEATVAGKHCWRRGRTPPRDRPSPTSWPRSPTPRADGFVPRAGASGRLRQRRHPLDREADPDPARLHAPPPGRAGPRRSVARRTRSRTRPPSSTTSAGSERRW